MIYGKDEIAANPDHLAMLVSIANLSLFSKKPTITVQNAEGAVLFQLLFQVYIGANALDA